MRLFFPWAWTIAFSIAILIVVVEYNKHGVLTPEQKNQFNILTTGFILFLGLTLLVREHYSSWLRTV